jgi:hypothetical protein
MWQIRSTVRPWLSSGFIVLPVVVVLCVFSPLANSLTDPRFLVNGILNTALPLLSLVGSTILLIAYFRDRKSADLVRRAVGLALVVLVARSLPFFQTVPEVLRFPYCLTDEGRLYKPAWLLAQGRPIYHAWDNPVGGIDALYPPLFYALLAGLMAVLPPGIYLLRCLIVSCSLGITILCWRIVYRMTQSWTSALTACMVLFVGALDYDCLTTTRPDSLAFLFSLAGFAVALFGIGLDRDSTEDIRRPALFGSAALCFLASISKHNYLAAPAAIGLYLLVHRRWNSAFLFAAAFGAPWLITTALLTWVTNGRYLFLTWRILGYAPYSWDQWHDQIWIALRTCILLSPLPIVYLWRNRRHPRQQLLILYLILSALSTIAAAKFGSSPSYAMQMVGLFGIAWGLSLHSLSAGRRGAVLAHAFLLLAGVTLTCLGLRAVTRRPVADLPERVRITEPLIRVMRRLPGPFLEEDPYMLILAGKPDTYFEGQIELTLARTYPNRRAAIWKDLADGKYNLVAGRPASGPYAYMVLDPADRWILEKHHRALRRDEFLADELPVYENCVVLVPCSENCGLPFDPPSPPLPLDPYRRMWQFVQDRIHSPGH